MVLDCSFCANTSADELLFEGQLRTHVAYICRECIRTYADMLMVGLTACDCDSPACGGLTIIHRERPERLAGVRGCV